MHPTLHCQLQLSVPSSHTSLASRIGVCKQSAVQQTELSCSNFLASHWLGSCLHFPCFDPVCNICPDLQCWTAHVWSENCFHVCRIVVWLYMHPQWSPRMNSESTGGSAGLQQPHERTVFAWGSHQSGQLGLGGTVENQSLVPVEVTSFRKRCLRHVACGELHTVFIMQDGTVYTCGSNNRGQLGHSKAPTRPGMTVNFVVVVVMGSLKCVDSFFPRGSVHAIKIYILEPCRASGNVRDAGDTRGQLWPAAHCRLEQQGAALHLGRQHQRSAGLWIPRCNAQSDAKVSGHEQ